MGFQVLDSSGRLKIIPTSFIGEFTTTSTGNIDDLDFANAAIIRMNNATLATIRGLKAGYGGQQVTIISIGAGQVDLSHQDTGDGTAANRLINIATVGKTSLSAGTGKALYVYDGTTARWRLTSHLQGASILVPFTAGDYTGNGAQTWTLTAGDMLAFSYILVGKKLFVSGYFNTTTVGGTPDTDLRVKVPGGFTANDLVIDIARVKDSAAAYAAGVVYTLVAGTTINFQTITGANWAAATDATAIQFSINFDIT